MTKAREMSDAKFLRLALAEGADSISAGRNTGPRTASMNSAKISANPRYQSRAHKVLKKRRELTHS